MQKNQYATNIKNMFVILSVVKDFWCNNHKQIEIEYNSKKVKYD
ncbi:MAG: hypothetical protein K0Q97_3059 [Bacillota bacterium]|jgi:hypothetical protein|nr:hypothetical protein [Bacillota bacterium]